MEDRLSNLEKRVDKVEEKLNKINLEEKQEEIMPYVEKIGPQDLLEINWGEYIQSNSEQPTTQT